MNGSGLVGCLVVGNGEGLAATWARVGVTGRADVNVAVTFAATTLIVGDGAGTVRSSAATVAKYPTRHAPANTPAIKSMRASGLVWFEASIRQMKASQA